MESQASTLALVPGDHPQRELGYSQTHSVGGATSNKVTSLLEVNKVEGMKFRRSEVKVARSSPTLCDPRTIQST